MATQVLTSNYQEQKIVFTQIGDLCFFVNGYPAPVTVDDWRRHHLQSFPAFADVGKEETGNAIINEAIQTVYAMFLGVMDLWASQEPQAYFDKTQLCYRFLICWYIADIYPDFSRGILTTGGLPIAQKKIGPITVGYNQKILNGTDPLSSLLSNPFGVKAHSMIKNGVYRLKVRGIPVHGILAPTSLGWFLEYLALGGSGKYPPPVNNKNEGIE